MLSQLIDIINSSLKAYYKTGLFYNITELVPEINEDLVSFYPAIIDEFGDAKIVSIDNLESAIFYHRLTSKQTTLRDTQYGASNKEVIDTYTLSLYIIGNRRKLKENAADTSLRVTSMIPDTFLQDGRQVAFTVMTNVDFNSSAIINAEFPNTEYAGMLDVFIIRHDYNIRHTYRKKCTECKTDCSNYSTLN